MPPINPISEADRIAAQGITIDTVTGPVQLRYTFRSLAQLEDAFGDLNKAADRLEVLLQRALEGFNKKGIGKIINDLGVFLAAGLGGGHSPEDALELLPSTNLREGMVIAATACVGAWVQAFPAARAEGNDDASAADSPGPTSTGSSPASPAAPTSSSGT